MKILYYSQLKRWQDPRRMWKNLLEKKGEKVKELKKEIPGVIQQLLQTTAYSKGQE